MHYRADEVKEFIRMSKDTGVTRADVVARFGFAPGVASTILAELYRSKLVHREGTKATARYYATKLGNRRHLPVRRAAKGKS
jgi:hypothetical protein